VCQRHAVLQPHVHISFYWVKIFTMKLVIVYIVFVHWQEILVFLHIIFTLNTTVTDH